MKSKESKIQKMEVKIVDISNRKGEKKRQKTK